MKERRLIMGTPVTVEIINADLPAFHPVFDYFSAVDERFSTYKATSEVSQINRGALPHSAYSPEMQEVLRLAGETKQATGGYFDVYTPEGALDPSGIVKGWAVNNAAKLIRAQGHVDFWVDAGGDIQTGGKNVEGKEWSAGIRSPFNENEVVKIVYPRGHGVATSGTYIRGEHIWNPHTRKSVATEIVSLTVIGPDVYEADRFATAAFAMGNEGIRFIESLPGFEGYAIDKHGTATMTGGFSSYTDIPGARVSL